MTGMTGQQGRGDFGYGALDNRNVDQQEAPQSNQGQSNEFADRSQQISSAIFKISNSVSTLEKAVRQLGTPSDSVMLRNRIQANLQATNKIVNETTITIKEMSIMARTLGRSSRLQVDRLTNEYQESVQRYGAVQKKVASKMRSCPSVPSKAPPTSTDVVHDEDHASLMEDARRQGVESQLQQQDQQIEYDSGLLESREEQIRQIEAAMLDVNEIFRDLSAMVSDQADVVDSIEANIDTAHSNVEGANTQLQTAKRYQKKARRKMCCLLGTLATVLVIIAIILIIKFHN